VHSGCSTREDIRASTTSTQQITEEGEQPVGICRAATVRNIARYLKIKGMNDWFAVDGETLSAFLYKVSKRLPIRERVSRVRLNPIDNSGVENSFKNTKIVLAAPSIDL
jgi:hypothetical protein